MLSVSAIQGIYKLVQGFKSIQVKYIPRGLDWVHCTQTEQTQRAPHILYALATCLYLRNSRQELSHSVPVCCHHIHTQLEMQPEITAGDPSTMPCRAGTILVGKAGSWCHFCSSQKGSTAPLSLSHQLIPQSSVMVVGPNSEQKSTGWSTGDEWDNLPLSSRKRNFLFSLWENSPKLSIQAAKFTFYIFNSLEDNKSKYTPGQNIVLVQTWK